jgi:hypothetical protein
LELTGPSPGITVIVVVVYNAEHNIVYYIFYATKINSLPDNGPVKPETCRSLIF